jgi:single-strand DNA-binding protein
MATMNYVALAGNLTRDPEMRQTPAGKSVCEFGLAVSDNYAARDGTRVEQTCFANIVAWNRQADACGEHLAKGSAVLVEGRLHFEQWEGNDGQKRSRLKVWANRVEFLGRPRREAEPDAAVVGREAAADPF